MTRTDFAKYSVNVVLSRLKHVAGVPLFVSCQGRTGTKFHLADAALVGLLPRVQPFVIFQVGLLWERFTASVAHKGPFSSVSSFVGFQVRPLVEARLARQTPEWSLARMHCLVVLQLDALCKCLLAEEAAERLVARVCPLVYDHVAFVGAGVRTETALVLAFPLRLFLRRVFGSGLPAVAFVLGFGDCLFGLFLQRMHFKPMMIQVCLGVEQAATAHVTEAIFSGGQQHCLQLEFRRQVDPHAAKTRCPDASGSAW